MKRLRRCCAALLLALAGLLSGLSGPSAHAAGVELRDASGELCTVPSTRYIRARELNTVGQWVYAYCTTRFDVLYAYRLLPYYAISQPWVFWANAADFGLSGTPLQVPYVAEAEGGSDVYTTALRLDLYRAIVADADRPQRPAWAVSASAISTTRPTYPYTGGVRGTASNGRVASGTRCDCAVRSVEGAVVYCGVPASPLVVTQSVAVCTRVAAPVSAPVSGSGLSPIAAPLSSAAGPALLAVAPPPAYPLAEPIAPVIPPVIAPAEPTQPVAPPPAALVAGVAR